MFSTNLLISTEQQLNKKQYVIICIQKVNIITRYNEQESIFKTELATTQWNASDLLLVLYMIEKDMELFDFVYIYRLKNYTISSDILTAQLSLSLSYLAFPLSISLSLYTYISLFLLTLIFVLALFFCHIASVLIATQLYLLAKKTRSDSKLFYRDVMGPKHIRNIGFVFSLFENTHLGIGRHDTYGSVRFQE